MDTSQPATVETYESLATLVEHVLLKPDLSLDDIEEGCHMAREYRIAAVLVRPCDVGSAVRWMEHSGVAVAAAVNYPYGNSTTASKLYEGRDLLRQGAQELDFVLNSAAMASRQFSHVETELMQIAQSCREEGAQLKVVFNNRYLQDDLKIIATKISKRIEAAFISIDHTEQDLALLRPVVKDAARLKCAGPVDGLETALTIKAAGYSRFGTTATPALLDAWKQRLAAQVQETS